MKKLSNILLSLFIIALAACTSDDSLMDGGALFTVTMPGSINSRAISDGLSAKELHYALYKKTASNTYKLLYVKNEGEIFSGHVANIKIDLVNDVEYRIAFFAKSSSAPYVIDESTGILNMNYGTAESSNSDIYDAFYATADVVGSNNLPAQTVTLARPFAQINIGAIDWAEAKHAGYIVENTSMSFTTQVYSALNLVNGEVSNPVELTYNLAKLPDATGSGASLTPAKLNVGSDSYDWMCMNYVLVGAEKDIIPTFTFSYTGPRGAINIPVNAVPAQRNHRTNIVGKFFTSAVDYKIIVDEAFDDEDFNETF